MLHSLSPCCFLLICSSLQLTRPSISQFWSLKIYRLTFLNYVKFANLPILRLQNCEMFGQGTYELDKPAMYSTLYMGLFSRHFQHVKITFSKRFDSTFLPPFPSLVFLLLHFSRWEGKKREIVSGLPETEDYLPLNIFDNGFIISHGGYFFVFFS